RPDPRRRLDGPTSPATQRTCLGRPRGPLRRGSGAGGGAPGGNGGPAGAGDGRCDHERDPPRQRPRPGARGRGDVGRRQLRRVAARRGRGARPRPRPAPRRDAARRPDADERPRALPHAHPRRRDRGRWGVPRALVRAAAGGGGVSPPCSRVLRRLPLRVLLALATAAMAVCARAPAEGAGWRTGFVVAALAASGLVALAWRRGGFSTRQVLGLGLLLRLLVFPLTPVLSDDGLGYVWEDRKS